MNPIIRMISNIFAAVDGAIGGMDRRTQDTVKQAAYFLGFCVIAASVGFGIYLGRKSARIGAAPMFQNINQIFEIDVKRGREAPFTRTLVESDQINEITDPELKRILFPSQAGREPTVSESVVEPETDKKQKAAEMAGAEGPAEIDRTDSKPGEPDVRALKRREAGEGTSAPRALESRETGEGVVLRKGGGDVRSPEAAADDAGSPAPGKTIRVYRKKSPNPLDSGPGVIDR